MSMPLTCVVLLTVTGLFVRLYALGARGFWWDEIVFAYSSRISSLGDLMSYAHHWNDRAPLSFVLVWLVRGLGADEVAVRFPFVIAGVLGVPAIYLLGRILAHPRVGIIAATLYTLSPFAVFVSQDAHPYAPLILFTILQMIFVYRAATSSRPRDWAGLALFTLLNLYNDYLALAVAGITSVFLATAFLGRLVLILRNRPESLDESTVTPASKVRIREFGIQVAWLLGTAIAVVLFYFPWLSITLAFLQSPVRSFYFARAGPVAFDDIRTLGNSLGFDKVFAIFLLAGVLYCVLTLHKRPIVGLLLLTWVGVPLAGLWWLAGERMFILQTRYYSYLLPAAFILIAMAAHRLILLVTDSYARFFGAKSASTHRSSILTRYAPGVASAGIVAILLLLTIPTLIRSYSWPKPIPQQFREATERIIADSPPGSMALSIGMWNLKPAPVTAYPVQGIEYYLWLYRSEIPYLDASLLDEYTVAHLGNRNSIMWGALAIPSPIDQQYVQSAYDLGLELFPMEGITLVRQRAPRDSPAQQLDTLLAWGVALQPGLVATRALLNPEYRTATLGENLLPPISDVQTPARSNNLLNGEQQWDRWVLWANSALAPDGQSLLLSSASAQGETNITLSTRKLMPGATYVLIFHYRNAEFQGRQRVYLSTNEDPDTLIDTYPYGDGFYCLPNSNSASAFAFKVPTITDNELLWLRINGEGTAEFSGIELRPLR